MPTPGSSKRLTRLMKSGICSCSIEDATKYANDLQQLADKVMNPEIAKKKRKVFKALADEIRLRILSLLQVREMCVCEIMIALDLTQPTASHHLGILENVELVKARKKGKWVFYSLNAAKLNESIRGFCGL